MTYEYLSAGPDRPGPRRRVWWPFAVLGAALAVVLLGTVVVTGLWVVRNLEMRALVSAVERSELEMTRTQDRVRAAFAPYAGAAALTPEERERLLAALSAVAADGRDRVAAAGEQVAASWTVPWDGSVRDARTAYLAHNQAWVAYLAAAAQDPVQLTQPQADVDRTWREVQPVLRAAVPRPALFDLVARVDAVFAEPEPEPEPVPEPTGPVQPAALA